ncbi:tyrosine--tRNA ligase, partial [bacterium (Candidatus Howlettbacteria) CG23_combo_of_CG06-09_8_20_14_all_37_9]
MDQKELLTRGIEEIYTKTELEKWLKEDKKLKIYYGVDPSGSIIHLGHAVILRKLRDLQKLGHKIIFLIGDFTGTIGDPTDRTAVRQPLTREQVLENAKSYREQASKFIDFEGSNKAEIKYNSEWLDKLNFKEIIELSANFTVQQLLQRDMFEKRIADSKPIHLHEFLYPLMQGYDAVSLEADVQIGGTDQTFNMLAGRQLSKQLKNKTNVVISCPLLEGNDGRKMS